MHLRNLDNRQKENTMSTRSTTIGFVALCGWLALAVGGCGGIIDDKAEARFRAAVGDTSITVFPAFVREGAEHRYDAGAAKRIADFMTQEKLATATVSDAEVPITSKWGMNQARMFRDSAADFSTYIGEHPIQTAYALLPEYLIGGRGKVGGVHIYLLDAEGTVAYAALFNSHHKLFNDVNPQNTDDCTTIVINNLSAEFKSAAEAP
jgi:hypothetical protein